MAVLITSDNDKELFLVKTLIDYGMHAIDREQREAFKKADMPMDVKITFNKISDSLVREMEAKIHPREESTLE